jgi:tetratricopeptide (TPR) repeat protein
MLGVLLAGLLLAETAETRAVEDELRRAKNEYAYGNYDRAADILSNLLYPMRLTTDEQVIEARKYLALSYYLLDRLDQVGEEFSKLLHIDPDYVLDPFTIAPPVIDMFESIRRQLKPELDAIRQLRSDTKLQQPVKPGVQREIERRITEQSELATFMPFGVGQFQNGQMGWGIAFAVTELFLLAVNIAAYTYTVRMIGDYRSSERSRVQTLTVTQYGALALFGLTWSLGVFQARLHFVPILESPETVRELPVSGGLRFPPPGLLVTLTF